MIAIVGPGAVGLGIGSALLAAGERLLFVCRTRESATALREHGFTRSGILGERRFEAGSFEATSELAQLRERHVEWILVCSKTPAAPALAKELGALWRSFDPEPRLVLCHNGWGTSQLFAEQIDPSRVFNARVITGFRRDTAHSVEVTVHADEVRIGSLYGEPAQTVAALCAAIDRGDLPCSASQTIEQDLWGKMLYNCALNPLGALVGVPYGVLGDRPETRAILEAVVAEIFGVIEHSGHRTHWRSAREYLELFWSELLPATASHESSMLLDLRAGRRTEVDQLTGAVAALARQHGVSVPVCTALTQLIRGREDRLAALH